MVGGILNRTCSYGAKVLVCNEMGHWEYLQNDCACKADGIWDQAQLNTVSEVVCGNGGRLRRKCNDKGQWSEVEDFRCRCPIDGIWMVSGRRYMIVLLVIVVLRVDGR